MKALCFALVSLSAVSANASPVCSNVAKAVVAHKYHVSPDLNPDLRQPARSGVYQLVIWKDDCFWDVTVKMQQTEDTCRPVSQPYLDRDSANCG